MLVTGVLFVAVTAVVKHVGSELPAPEAAFLRYLLGLVFLLPMIRPMLRAGLDRSAMRFFAVRGVAHALGVMLWFYAMTQIAIAEVTSMGYLTPVMVTIGAALFLGERMALRRILAVLCALLGAFIVLRPGFREISSGHLAMLANGVFFSTSYLIAKIMADRVPAAVVVGWLSIIVTLALAPFAYAVWVWPTGEQIAWMFLVAALATAGHYTMTLALGAAPIAVTQPVTFLQLVWATALGALVFSEPVDGWVILGGTVIIASVSFIAWREAMLKRRAVTPPVVATKV
ncbi:Arginine/ornithine antiporter ArcD [Candidatus Rhodobacter oscarellae]|uniref:Arginine/ornithine antiporter ArcD n=2 Tax=Candidatus Rhodobacter oscarellae TaxID=1675527 RepID=A0A0J9E920_9RHOB|nr:Arginine/ornithine antiporter ArcD [Candidatus Rhodobacter lobularis]